MSEWDNLGGVERMRREKLNELKLMSIYEMSERDQKAIDRLLDCEAWGNLEVLDAKNLAKRYLDLPGRGLCCECGEDYPNKRLCQHDDGSWTCDFCTFPEWFEDDEDDDLEVKNPIEFKDEKLSSVR